MSDLIKFRIPWEFIADRTILTPGELAYGLENDWIRPADAVKLALDGYNVFGEESPPYRELALVLSSDLDRVQEIAESLLVDCDKCSKGVWIFLALAWVYEHRDSYPDPLGVVEMLAADFGYPTEIQRLVRFMPVASGEKTGVDALMDKWREYLDRSASEYRTRLVV